MIKRGQLDISFGMIFSIILIIVFIVVAIYGAIVFLNMKKCTETGLFKNDLQAAIDSAWNGEYADSEITRSLPSNIDFVCFIDLSKKESGTYKNYYENATMLGNNFNMFFWPLKSSCKSALKFEIEHINTGNITKNDNPYCIQNVKGKTTVKIEKSFSDMLVNLK